MDLASGILGKVIGGPKNAPTNIAGAVALMSMLSVFILTMCPAPGGTANEQIKSLLPVVTMILGYLLGKSD
jgi:hypothetical protein